MTSAAVTAIWLKSEIPDRLLSILKPVSLVELSVQLRLIWLDETAAAVREDGAVGGRGVGGKGVGDGEGRGMGEGLGEGDGVGLGLGEGEGWAGLTVMAAVA